MNVDVVVRLVVARGKRHGAQHKGRGSALAGDSLSAFSDDQHDEEAKGSGPGEDGFPDTCVTACSSTALRSGFKVFDVDAVTEVAARSEASANETMSKVFERVVRPVVHASQRSQKTGLILLQGCAHREDFSWLLEQLVDSCLQSGGKNSMVRLSGTEIWNETTRDLISPEIHEEQVLASKGSSVKVRAAADVHGLVSLLQKRRKRARGQKGFLSHLVVTLSWGDGCAMDLVDLADAQGGDVKDQRSIKKSRLALEKVICALHPASTLNRGGHVPFRDSKLTRVLQPTLLQPSRAVLLATVSEAATDSVATLSTLEFCNNIRRSKRMRRGSKTSTMSAPSGRSGPQHLRHHHRHRASVGAYGTAAAAALAAASAEAAAGEDALAIFAGAGGTGDDDAHSVADSEYSKQSFSTLGSLDVKSLGLTEDEGANAYQLYGRKHSMSSMSSCSMSSVTSSPRKSDGAHRSARGTANNDEPSDPKAVMSTCSSAQQNSLVLTASRGSSASSNSFGHLQRDNRAKARLINILASETVGKGDAIKSLVQESRDKQKALELAREEMAAQREIILQMRGQIEEQQLQIEQLQEHERRMRVRSASTESAALTAHRDSEGRLAALEQENERLVAQTATAAEEYTIRLKKQNAEIEALRAELGLARAEQDNVRIQHDAQLTALQEAFAEEKTALKREAIDLAHEVRYLEEDHDRFQIDAAAATRASLCAELRAVGKARVLAAESQAVQKGALVLLKAARRSHELLRGELRSALGAAAAFRLAAALSAGPTAKESDVSPEASGLQKDLQDQIDGLEASLRERDATIESLEAFLLSPPSTPYGGSHQQQKKKRIDEDEDELKAADVGLMDDSEERDELASAREDWAEIARLRTELEAARLAAEHAQKEKRRVLTALEHKNATISQLSAERNALDEEKTNIMREAFEIVAWLHREDDRKSKLIAQLLRENAVSHPGIASLANLSNLFCPLAEDAAKDGTQENEALPTPPPPPSPSRRFGHQGPSLAPGAEARKLPMPSPLASLD